MSLPNVDVVIDNENVGQITLFDDGIVGSVLTGTVVSKRLDLNKVYVLSDTTGLEKLGIEQDTNPLLHRELMAFYATAGGGVRSHPIVVSEAITLTQMCATAEDPPLKELAGSVAGRIRLVNINRNPPAEYSPAIESGLDTDVQIAIQVAQNIAESFLSQLAPLRLFLPVIGRNEGTSDLYQPHQDNYNRVAMVLASDRKSDNSKLYSAAIGQVLGWAAEISIHQNLGRIRSGAIAGDNFLTDGKTPREHYEHWPQLDDAGYILYRSSVGKDGYYLNGDATATAVSDNYCFLSSGHVIDKATMIVYQTYIDDILDNIQMDAKDGTISTLVYKGYEANAIRTVSTDMAGEISSFSAYINPGQNAPTNGRMDIACTIIPLATLRGITVSLSFKNPA